MTWKAEANIIRVSKPTVVSATLEQMPKLNAIHYLTIPKFRNSSRLFATCPGRDPFGSSNGPPYYLSTQKAQRTARVNHS
ncbi:hypothetical protein L484_007587 [Morus notabilis]|uniref:Uncharacterized protein n=1 Tax=Morus notabilis TaxID=981085 RepID=W9RJK1_9ROSA|nr:hypothetical protein L484_007587 [Morus notabilis]